MRPLLAAGCRLLAVGGCLSAAGSLLAAGGSVLAARCWLLAVGAGIRDPGSENSGISDSRLVISDS